MLFADVSVLDEHFAVKPHQWVAVQGGVIAYVGDSDPRGAMAAGCGAATAPAEGDSSVALPLGAAPAMADFGEVVDGAGRLLMPALYNTHAHSPMTLLRGYAENLPLDRWLNEKCFPFEAKMTGDDCYWGTLLACAEMARFGVVSFSDMYYHADRSAQAVLESGMKANFSGALVAFEDKPFSDYPEYTFMEQLGSEWNGAADGRIRVDYNLHSEYLTNETVARDVVALAKEKGLRMHIHLSETAKEVEECRGRHGGMSPVAYFEAIGLFEVPTTAAHCVWVDEADMDILAQRGVFVANNPASNLKLGSGFAPIPRMFEKGVNVCLGSDGMASNNNHNLFSDLYVMGLIYKGHDLDSAVVHPKQILTAATRTGALSQGREDCGCVKVGFKADLTILDISGPQWCPMTSPLYNVVFAGDGSDVVLTLCDGEVVFEAGEWPGIDVERAQAEVAARAHRIIASLV